MHKTLLSALFAITVGLAGASGANAAPVANVDLAAIANSSLTLAQYSYSHKPKYSSSYRSSRAQSYRNKPRYSRHRTRCRSVNVCRWTFFGRICHVERVCYR